MPPLDLGHPAPPLLTLRLIPGLPWASPVMRRSDGTPWPAPPALVFAGTTWPATLTDDDRAATITATAEQVAAITHGQPVALRDPARVYATGWAELLEVPTHD